MIDKYLSYRFFLKKRYAQNLQNCVERLFEFEFLFQDGNKDEDRQGNPDLRVDRVERGAIEGLDAQMLFDPFEEQFDLPARAIDLGDRDSIQQEVVCEKDRGTDPSTRNAARDARLGGASQFGETHGAGRSPSVGQRRFYQLACQHPSKVRCEEGKSHPEGTMEFKSITAQKSPNAYLSKNLQLPKNPLTGQY
jgi:hypothetical protein